MTEHSLDMLVCLAATAMTAILIYLAIRINAECRMYIARCGQIAAVTPADELRQTMPRILTNTMRINRSLQEQRRVLNDAHKRICAVTKWVEKPGH